MQRTDCRIHSTLHMACALQEEKIALLKSLPDILGIFLNNNEGYLGNLKKKFKIGVFCFHHFCHGTTMHIHIFFFQFIKYSFQIKIVLLLLNFILS